MNKIIGKGNIKGKWIGLKYMRDGKVGMITRIKFSYKWESIS